MSFHLDFETRSPQDLTEVGAYRYAEDPECRILMAAISHKEDGPYLWVHPLCETDLLSSDPKAENLLLRMVESEEPIYAHNAQFERAVMMFRSTLDLGISTPAQSRWRCTSAMARKAQIPDSLEKAAFTLGLDAQKDKRGKDLIKLFSMPDADGSFADPSDHMRAFAEFGDYCLQDVRVEKELQVRLASFELSGIALEAFQLDIRLNDKGIPFNVPALRNASRILEECYTDANAAFFELCGYRPTQREKVRSWCNDRGAKLLDMRGATLDAWLENNPSHSAFAVVSAYSDLNFAAAKKVDVILACVNADGRVRGTLLWHGAGTGRWAGRLIQPQNFKKPTIKQTDLAYKMICEGCSRGDLETVFGNPLEVIASCIRHFLQADVEQLDADYNAVEARIINWLAGQEDILQEFREGKDPYKRMAGTIYNRRPEAILNPSPERDLGKTAELGCGFSMGAEKFKESCHQKGLLFVTDELAQKAVQGYRNSHAEVVEHWKDHELAARRAILQPGRWFNAGNQIAYIVKAAAGMDFLLMKLPSGRCLSYPQPRLEMEDDESLLRRQKKWLSAERKEQVTFWGKLKGVSWGRCKLYGGLLAENATQATAADLMTYGTCEAERQGYDIFTLIHDQALARRLLGQTAEAFAAALSILPAWAGGLPLKAEAKITPFYRK